MYLYPNIFSYLTHQDPQDIRDLKLTLMSQDRPILYLGNQSLEERRRDPLLMARLESGSKSKRVFELATPYLKHDHFPVGEDPPFYTVELEIETEKVQLRVTDEVIDRGCLEEQQLEEWESTVWEMWLDSDVSDLISIFIRFITSRDLQKNRYGGSFSYRVLDLISSLKNFDIKEATEPLLIRMDKRYQIMRKLQQITPKLRYQLRRQAELMSVGRIQEMDSYCLRDYTRRPGHTPEEKAGSRQMLMGIQRYQDFGTYENRFLVYFSRKLHLECVRYKKKSNQEYRYQVKQMNQTIDRFHQEPSVKEIPARNFRLGTPNYVLLQNPIYNAFHKAYQDYLQQNKEKERVWNYRSQLLTDALILCCYGALLKFKGSQVPPLASLESRISPDQGRYLEQLCTKPIVITLKSWVYEFQIQSDRFYLEQGDITIKVRQHSLSPTSDQPQLKECIFPIWVFWYEPLPDVLEQAVTYLEKLSSVPLGIIAYLYPRRRDPSPMDPYPMTHRSYCLNREHSKLWVYSLQNSPNMSTNLQLDSEEENMIIFDSFDGWIHLIQDWVESWVALMMGSY